MLARISLPSTSSSPYKRALGIIIISYLSSTSISHKRCLPILRHKKQVTLAQNISVLFWSELKTLWEPVAQTNRFGSSTGHLGWRSTNEADPELSIIHIGSATSTPEPNFLRSECPKSIMSWTQTTMWSIWIIYWQHSIPVSFPFPHTYRKTCWKTSSQAERWGQAGK